MRRPCLDCGELVDRGNLCRPCKAVRERRRNALPRRQGYRDPLYRSQPRTGLCWRCGKPGADTRDHVVPLAVDHDSVATLPAHRSCNSGRGARA